MFADASSQERKATYALTIPAGPRTFLASRSSHSPEGKAAIEAREARSTNCVKPAQQGSSKRPCQCPRRVHAAAASCPPVCPPLPLSASDLGAVRSASRASACMRHDSRSKTGGSPVVLQLRHRPRLPVSQPITETDQRREAWNRMLRCPSRLA